MFTMRQVCEDDRAFWFTLDGHMSESEFALKIRDGRGYVIGDEEKSIGILRYNLFWDNIPFLSMIHFEEAYHQKGYGRQAVAFWEHEMRELGYKTVMTSTQVDEQAQHFYRKMGYIDRGSIFFDATPLAQPQELIMMKVL